METTDVSASDVPGGAEVVPCPPNTASNGQSTSVSPPARLSCFLTLALCRHLDSNNEVWSRSRCQTARARQASSAVATGAGTLHHDTQSPAACWESHSDGADGSSRILSFSLSAQLVQDLRGEQLLSGTSLSPAGLPERSCNPGTDAASVTTREATTTP
eukprot:1611857-Rhodomonas_salina.2